MVKWKLKDKVKKGSASHGESGYKRIDYDLYETPAWCTRLLLEHVDFDCPLISEPAHGKGAITRVLADCGYMVEYADIVNHCKDKPAISQPFIQDFLDREKSAHAIVTNPPYSHAYAFVMHALGLTKMVHGKVAMIFRVEWDTAKGRMFLFNEMPFSKKIIMCKRPHWIGEEKGASARFNYAWYVWDWKHKGPAELIYTHPDDLEV